MHSVDKRSHIHPNKFGYVPRNSCKHAYFVVNEVIRYYNANYSDVYVVSLKCSEGVRSPLEERPVFQIVIPYTGCLEWRALVNYKAQSRITIKYENQESLLIRTREGPSRAVFSLLFFLTFTLMVFWQSALVKASGA